MKSSVILLISIITFNTSIFGQENINQELRINTFYAEAFGQGLSYSFNYDRRIQFDKKLSRSITVGASFLPASVGFGDGTYYTIPISYNFLLGKKSHHLEMGLGLSNMTVPDGYWNDRISNYTYFSPKLSYRFQRPQGGLFFRASALLLVDILNVHTFPNSGKNHRNFSTFSNVVGLDEPIFPWPGLSFGYTF